MKILSLLLFFLAFLSFAAPVNADQRAYFSQAANRSYLLFIPSNYDQTKKWPLILHLHGAGTRGSNVELIRAEALPQIVDQKPDFAALVLSPLLTGSGLETYWTDEPIVASLNTLLDEIKANYSVDPAKVYITGYSLGGGGTWGIGVRYPDKFAALVPVAGFWGTQSNHGVPANICDLKNTPVWAFHGALDLTIPVSEEQKLVDALKNCGGSVQFTVYPSGDHGISGQAYTTPGLYDWLFAQTLGTVQPTSFISPSVTPPVNTPDPTLPGGGKPGDANADNLVDGLDYVVWLNNYNQAVSGSLSGDFDNNSTVDGLDYVIWLNNYNS